MCKTIHFIASSVPTWMLQKTSCIILSLASFPHGLFFIFIAWLQLLRIFHVFHPVRQETFSLEWRNNYLPWNHGKHIIRGARSSQVCMCCVLFYDLTLILPEGSIISFRVSSRLFVVLNDATSVRTLLEQRSNIYSDRPFLWMFNVICARGKAIFNVSSSDPRHRIYRRLLQHGLGTRATMDAWQSMKLQTCILLDGFEHTPDNWERHVKRWVNMFLCTESTHIWTFFRAAAAIIMKLAFGYNVQSLDDDFVRIADETSKISGWVSEPGRWLVERVPLSKWRPWCRVRGTNVTVFSPSSSFVLTWYALETPRSFVAR